MNNAACSQANFYVRSIELSELFIFTLILALSVLITHLYKLWTIYLVTPIVNTISSNPEIQIIPFYSLFLFQIKLPVKKQPNLIE